MKIDRHLIILQILESCAQEATKEKIVQQSDLNFKTVVTYLDIMLENDLICIKQESPLTYALTPKGEDLIKDIRIIRARLNKYRREP